MKSQYRFGVLIWIFSTAFLFSSVLLAMDSVNSVRNYDAYGLTNSNADQSAFFWVKTEGGKTSIVEVPPRSEKKLPLDTVDFQFLFMETKASPVSSMVTIGNMAFAGEKEDAQEEALRSFETNSANVANADARSIRRPEQSMSNQKFVKLRKFFAENW